MYLFVDHDIDARYQRFYMRQAILAEKQRKNRAWKKAERKKHLLRIIRRRENLKIALYGGIGSILLMTLPIWSFIAWMPEVTIWADRSGALTLLLLSLLPFLNRKVCRCTVIHLAEMLGL